MENEINNSSNTKSKKNILKDSSLLKGIIIGIAVLLILIAVFSLGIFVGTQKARFSYRWAGYYHKNFGGPRGGFMKGFGGRNFIDGHGVFGEVIKIDKDVVIVKSKSDIEKSIIISDKTTITKIGQTIKVSELKVGDMVVIIGTPNDKGQIEARMIRVF
ncbi:MAG: hypothetical protein HY776_06950 [Actinobacteria bacterium]|nr:hypothetical protein [Actinomycetota bacterium]